MNAWGRLIGLSLVMILVCGAEVEALAQSHPSSADYRELSGQLMLDLAKHRQEYAFLTTLHLGRHVFRSDSGPNLSLVYENEKTLSGYGSNGVTAYVYVFVGSRSFEQAASAEQIGELKIVTICKGPQGKAFQALMRKVINSRRQEFASKFKI
jgi:hypothetical protein